MTLTPVAIVDTLTEREIGSGYLAHEEPGVSLVRGSIRLPLAITQAIADKPGGLHVRIHVRHHEVLPPAPASWARRLEAAVIVALGVFLAVSTGAALAFALGAIFAGGLVGLSRWRPR